MPFKSRWNPEEKIRIVAESLNTSVSIAELCRKYNVSPGVFYSWREKFIEGGKQALIGSGSGRDGANKELLAELERLKRLIGELTIANDAFKKTLESTRGRGSW
jgi:transposase